MTTSAYKKQLAAARRKAEAGEYAEALAAVDTMLEQWPASPALHVLRAELIQLQEAEGPELEEARRELDQAIALDDRFLPALLEKGHYQFAVEDDAKGAAKIFDQAVRIATEFLIASLLGRAMALLEAGRKEEAFHLLARVDSLRQEHAGSSPPEWSQRMLDLWSELTGAA